jgi:hypothetical protein
MYRLRYRTEKCTALDLDVVGRRRELPNRVVRTARTGCRRRRYDVVERDRLAGDPQHREHLVVRVLVRRLHAADVDERHRLAAKYSW